MDKVIVHYKENYIDLSRESLLECLDNSGLFYVIRKVGKGFENIDILGEEFDLTLRIIEYDSGSIY